MAARIAANTESRRLNGADAAELKRRAAAQRAYEMGAHGERLVAQELQRLPGNWRTLHDVAWPGRQRANLDHVVIGPPGVFIVDAKNYSARFRVAANGTPFAGRYPQTKEIGSCASQAASVAALLQPQHRLLVDGVMCLVRQDHAAQRLGGTTVLGLRQLRKHLMWRERRLTDAEIVAVAHYLHARLRTRGTGQLNTADLSAAARQRQPAAVVRTPPVPTPRRHTQAQAPRPALTRGKTGRSTRRSQLVKAVIAFVGVVTCLAVADQLIEAVAAALLR